MENILSLRAISLQQRSLIQYVVTSSDVKSIAQQRHGTETLAVLPVNTKFPLRAQSLVT